MNLEIISNYLNIILIFLTGLYTGSLLMKLAIEYNKVEINQEVIE